ncbi:MAG: hypothetical protein LM568_01915 [Desulfurococcaceae archaeon]|nr:hypothetical protein [Desulfurococcaceae archaeon]
MNQDLMELAIRYIQVSLYPKEQDRYPLIKSTLCSKRTQLILNPPPNISTEPPLIKISKQTPTPTSITSTLKYH